jgi:predicted DNA-binding transcriptional regulator YafY
MTRKRRRPSASRTLRRQWAIGIFLQQHAWTTFGIAKAFKISKATAQRDIDLLRGLFKIKVTRDRGHSQRILYQMQGRFVTIL